MNRPIIRAAVFLAFLAPLAVWPASAAGPAEPFVRISPRDSRYFELSDGRPYVPVGLNMVAPPGDRGMEGMEAWFDKLAENRGNFVRIWLAAPHFDVEHARSGQYDDQKARRIDQLLAIARRHGIRLKLCIESFRHLGEGRQRYFGKPIHRADQGGPARTTAEFFDSPSCREQFKRKLAWFQKRYGDDPIIFGWELWNEMDCIQGGDWADWTAEMLPELHRLFPQNLAMQSLGSFDNASKRARYRRLCEIPGNDVLQVHRYLDLGASLDVCHGPVDLLAADAVGELLAFGVRKPILLAESGAVEPSHSGPFKLYAEDKAGILLHDVLFAPFFAGAAGPGHIWHWDVYVDRNNLWGHFARFAEAIDGLDPPAEGFQPIRIPHARLHVLALRGKTTLVAWCRDAENTWQTELAEHRPPQPVRDARLTLDLAPDWLAGATASFYDPWTGEHGRLALEGNRLVLPEFTRSVVVRVCRTAAASSDSQGRVESGY
jgi:hypothetical protein